MSAHNKKRRTDKLTGLRRSNKENLRARDHEIEAHWMKGGWSTSFLCLAWPGITLVDEHDSSDSSDTCTSHTPPFLSKQASF